MQTPAPRSTANSDGLCYLDHAATTPMRPEAIAAMLPYLAGQFANPSGSHRFARQARAALDDARAVVAGELGSAPREVIFTSGGTESDNAALRGIALARRERTGANRIVVSAVEHKAVLATGEELRDHAGFHLTVLPVDAQGRVDPAGVAVTFFTSV